MTEWLGIGHLFELSRTEAILGFFTPLAIFAVFLVVQLVLPGRRVTGYAIDPETGSPRSYRLNGIFIVGLFISRQRVDERLCAGKYGAEKWAEYRARVKWRIIPGVY